MIVIEASDHKETRGKSLNTNQIVITVGNRYRIKKMKTVVSMDAAFAALIVNLSLSSRSFKSKAFPGIIYKDQKIC